MRAYRRTFVAAFVWALAAGQAAADRPAHSVYQSQFGTGTDKHWSVDKVAGGRLPFLGELHTGEAVLTLRDLPEHKRLRLQCDLLILRSWDGDVQGDGPDTLMISLDDGRQLLAASFSNNSGMFGGGGGQFGQSFPDGVGLARHAPATGCLKQNDDLAAALPNTVYRLDFTFPHSNKDVRITFGAKLQEILDENRNSANESWGLASVRVEALSEPVEKLTAAAATTLLTELGGQDPVKAQQALWRFVAAGPETLTHLRDLQLLAVKQGEADEVRRLVSRLDDDNFAIREATMKALQKMPAARRNPILSEILRGEVSPEQKHRIEALLAERPEPDDLLRGRLLHLLHVIGSEEAGDLAKRIAPPRMINGPKWEEGPEVEREEDPF
jgi:hypothetical protein